MSITFFNKRRREKLAQEKAEKENEQKVSESLESKPKESEKITESKKKGKEGSE